jgi:hypothetical protein
MCEVLGSIPSTETTTTTTKKNKEKVKQHYIAKTEAN